MGRIPGNWAGAFRRWGGTKAGVVKNIFSRWRGAEGVVESGIALIFSRLGRGRGAGGCFDGFLARISLHF